MKATGVEEIRDLFAVTRHKEVDRVEHLLGLSDPDLQVP